jgi:hypothetical protein
MLGTIEAVPPTGSVGQWLSTHLSTGYWFKQELKKTPKLEHG